MFSFKLLLLFALLVRC